MIMYLLYKAYSGLLLSKLELVVNCQLKKTTSSQSRSYL